MAARAAWSKAAFFGGYEEDLTDALDAMLAAM
jgi:hypothetical protein